MRCLHFLVLVISPLFLLDSVHGEQKALPEQAFNKGSSSSSKSENIRWTSGDNTGKHASAPRSQKYWNDHNLNKNKPDYAKTDEEVFFERWGYHPPSVAMKQPKNIAIAVVTFMALYIGFMILQNYISEYTQSSGGQKLGGGDGGVGETGTAATSTISEGGSSADPREQERLMRLAKFENAIAKKVTYNEAMAQAMGKDID
jgi:hypothetical protein